VASRFLKSNWSLVVILLIWLLFFQVYRNYRNVDKVFSYDVSEYYIYLPAWFIYQDPDFTFINEIDNRPHIAERTNIYEVPNGNRLSKMSMGMSLMYSPFFGLGHLGAKLSERNANGYSRPYSFWITLSGLIYAWIGLLLLLKILNRYFDNHISNIVILGIGLGTNLAYYAMGQGAMSHATSFFLFSLTLFITLEWKRKFSIPYSVLLGLSCAMLVLVRPVNIFFCFLPLLIDLRSPDHFTHTIRKNPKAVIIAGLAFTSLLSVQLVYWFVRTGRLMYYSYQEEGFNFLHPHILEVLFSFRKGWIIYTPLIIFAFAGLFLRSKKTPGLYPAIPLIICIQLYVLSCWENWWYGGSFGFRPMIEYMVLLAFPLAEFTRFAWNKTRKISMMILVFLIGLNLFQAYQYDKNIIHYDSMSWKAYKAVFLKMKKPDNYESLLNPPPIINQKD
jgi:hypothetical protein